MTNMRRVMAVTIMLMTMIVIMVRSPR